MQSLTKGVSFQHCPFRCCGKGKCERAELPEDFTVKRFSVGINWAFKKKKSTTPTQNRVSPTDVEARVGIYESCEEAQWVQSGFLTQPPLFPSLQPLPDIGQLRAQDPLQHQLLDSTPSYEVSLSSFTAISSSSSSCFQRMGGRGINSAPEDRHSCSCPAELGIPGPWRGGTDLWCSVVWDVYAHPWVTFVIFFFLKHLVMFNVRWKYISKS